MQQMNGHAHQPEAEPSLTQPGEMELHVVRQRVQGLKQAQGSGLFDLAECTVESLAEYRQRYQQNTGVPLTLREAFQQLASVIDLVSQ